MIHITNASSQYVIVDINGTSVFHIPAGETITSSLNYPDNTTVTLRHRSESYAKGSDAHLMLISTYTLSISAEVWVTVVREKICFDLNGYYDRFFLSAQGAQILSVHDEVSNVERVRKGLKKHRVLKAILYEPLLDLFIEPFIEFGIFGGLLFYPVLIILSAIFDLWLFVLPIFAGIWIISAVVELVTDKSIRLIFKKSGSPVETSLSLLSKWSDPKWIMEYYTQPDRKPFVGKTEN